MKFIETYWVFWSLSVIATISLLSLYPLGQLPAVPGSDKTHHVIAYSVLAFPVAIARPRHWIVIVLGYFLYSGLVEVLQPMVNRYGEWLDLAANGFGLLLGVVVASIARRHISDERDVEY